MISFLSHFAKGLLCAFIIYPSVGISSLTELKLGLNWKAEPEFGGFYTAELTGGYKKQGLSVTLIEGGAGTPVVQMVASQKLDFGIASGDELLLARARGADLVAIFTVFQTNPQCLMVRKASGLKSLKDLWTSDHTIALAQGLPYYSHLIKKYGKPKTKIVPYGGGITHFLTDSKFAQQCFVGSEPLLAEKKNVPAQTLLLSDEGYNPYTVVLITRNDVLKSQKETVLKLTNAVREGWLEYLRDSKTTHEHIAKLNPTMDTKTSDEVLKAQRVHIETPESKRNGIGTMTSQRWETLIGQLRELKLISKPLRAEDVFVNP